MNLSRDGGARDCVHGVRFPWHISKHSYIRVYAQIFQWRTSGILCQETATKMEKLKWRSHLCFLTHTFHALSPNKSELILHAKMLRRLLAL
jgi:hypothetical protein